MNIDVLKRSTTIEPTPHNIGLQLTVKIMINDKGQLYIDDEPVNRNHFADWVLSIAVLAEKVSMLQREHVKRVSRDDGVLLHRTPAGNELRVHGIENE